MVESVKKITNQTNKRHFFPIMLKPEFFVRVFWRDSLILTHH